MIALAGDLYVLAPRLAACLTAVLLAVRNIAAARNVRAFLVLLVHMQLLPIGHCSELSISYQAPCEEAGGFAPPTSCLVNRITRTATHDANEKARKWPFRSGLNERQLACWIAFALSRRLLKARHVLRLVGKDLTSISHQLYEWRSQCEFKRVEFRITPRYRARPLLRRDNSFHRSDLRGRAFRPARPHTAIAVSVIRVRA